MTVGMMPGVGPIARFLTTVGTSGGNAMIEARREGKSYDEALAYGLATGISEAGLETVLSSVGKGTLGVAGKAGNKAAENATKAFAKAHPKITKLLTTIGTHGGRIGGDFVDEYSQEILNPVFRNIIFDENNEVKLFTPEALEAGILGAVMSGVYDGFASSIDFASGKINDAKAIKALTNAGHTQAEAKAILDAYKSLINDPSYHEQIPEIMKDKYGNATATNNNLETSQGLEYNYDNSNTKEGNIEYEGPTEGNREDTENHAGASFQNENSRGTSGIGENTQELRGESDILRERRGIDFSLHERFKSERISQSGGISQEGEIYTEDDVTSMIDSAYEGAEVDFAEDSDYSKKATASEIMRKAYWGEKLSNSDVKAIAADERLAKIFNTAFGTEIDFSAKGAKTVANAAIERGVVAKKGASGATVANNNRKSADSVTSAAETTQDAVVRTTNDNNTAETTQNAAVRTTNDNNTAASMGSTNGGSVNATVASNIPRRIKVPYRAKLRATEVMRQMRLKSLILRKLRFC